MALSIEELEAKLIECETTVAGEIKAIKDQLSRHEIKMSDADQKRIDLAEKVDSIKTMLKEYMTDDKLQYTKVQDQLNHLTELIKELSEITMSNTSYIQSEQANSALEERVAKALYEEHRKKEEAEKPKKEFWGKVKLAVTISLILSALGSLGTLLWFGFQAYIKFGLDKL